MMNNEWYGFGGWMGGGWLWMLLLAVAFVLLIVWAVRGTAGSGSSQQQKPNERIERPTPLETLDMRFAKGEISEDEYKNMRRTLTGG
ncbi:MAG: SHOCT domain-containing protein [Caldilineaceae bacterium]